MAKRKLIGQGLGGVTIYLPKKWIEAKGLKAGDEISVAETEDKLIIASNIKINQEKEITLTSENKHDVVNMLTHIYRKGYNKITVNNADREVLKKIKHTPLLGFEITKIAHNTVILENITEPTDQKYEKLMHRIFFLLKENHNLIAEDLQTKKYTNVQEIKELRTQFDKFILFCRRILTKEKHEHNPLLEWELLTFLLHIQHAYYYLYTYCEEHRLKLDTKTLNLINDLNIYLETYSNAYLKKDIEAIHTLNKNKPHFTTIIKLLETAKGKQSVALAYIKELFRLIQIGTSPILANLFETEQKID